MIDVRIYGIAIYDVKKDVDTTLFDLENAGLHKLEYMEIDPDLTSYIDIAEEEFSHVLGKYKSARDYIFEFDNDRLILARFFVQGKSVSKVLLVSLKGGTLRIIGKRLEDMDWKREFMFEIRRLIKSVRYTD